MYRINTKWIFTHILKKKKVKKKIKIFLLKSNGSEVFHSRFIKQNVDKFGIKV